MTEAQTWLPPGVDTGKAEAALADSIARWSEHWFAGSKAASTGTLSRAREAGRDLRGIDWRGSAGAMVGGSGSAPALGAKAMGIATAIGDRTAADLEILRQLGEECLKDLHQRLGRLLHLADAQWVATAPAPDDWVYRASIGGGRDEPVRVAVALTPARLARLIKSCLPAPPALPALAQGAAALAGTELRLSAALGACEVTLAEVEALAPGDVLVLDSHVDAALPLAIEYLPAPRGACIVAREGDRLAFQLKQAPVG